MLLLPSKVANAVSCHEWPLWCFSPEGSFVRWGTSVIIRARVVIISLLDEPWCWSHTNTDHHRHWLAFTCHHLHQSPFFVCWCWQPLLSDGLHCVFFLALHCLCLGGIVTSTTLGARILEHACEVEKKASKRIASRPTQFPCLQHDWKRHVWWSLLIRKPSLVRREKHAPSYLPLPQPLLMLHAMLPCRFGCSQSSVGAW